MTPEELADPRARQVHAAFLPGGQLVLDVPAAQARQEPAGLDPAAAGELAVAREAARVRARLVAMGLPTGDEGDQDAADGQSAADATG